MRTFTGEVKDSTNQGKRINFLLISTSNAMTITLEAKDSSNQGKTIKRFQVDL